MVRNVLIVDDDQIWLRLIQKKFAKYSERFHTLVADDGVSAIRQLRENPISLVVTDLQMPEMDGLTLLAQLSESYPDIPVIIITAYSTPTYKKLVLERGAVGYIEKPFPLEDLAQKILTTLKKESEGGTLQTVPLEIFIQLIEMEQKTCTLRITHKQSGQRGVLLFRDGELLEARVKNKQGVKAAYEIFSWGEVSLSIEDACVLKERRIEEDLQAILLEAMRQHDEHRASESSQQNIQKEEMLEDETETLRPDSISPETEYIEPENAIPAFPENKSATNEQNPIERIRQQVLEVLGNPSQLEGIYVDEKWNHFLRIIRDIGSKLRAGNLRSCYVSNSDEPDLLLTGDDPPLVVSLRSKTRRHQLLDLF